MEIYRCIIIIIILFIMFFGPLSYGLIGPNVCSDNKSYSYEVNSTKLIPHKSRAKKWCWDITKGFKCKYEKVENKLENTTETKIGMRKIDICCNGYVEDENSCRPICAKTICVYGNCTAPETCRCDAGGINCNISMSAINDTKFIGNYSLLDIKGLYWNFVMEILIVTVILIIFFTTAVLIWHCFCRKSKRRIIRDGSVSYRVRPLQDNFDEPFNLTNNSVNRIQNYLNSVKEHPSNSTTNEFVGKNKLRHDYENENINIIRDDAIHEDTDPKMKYGKMIEDLRQHFNKKASHSKDVDHCDEDGYDHLQHDKPLNPLKGNYNRIGKRY